MDVVWGKAGRNQKLRHSIDRKTRNAVITLRGSLESENPVNNKKAHQKKMNKNNS